MCSKVKKEHKYIILTLIFALIFVVFENFVLVSSVDAHGSRGYFETNSLDEFIYLPLVIKQLSLLPGEHALDGSWKGDAITDGYPSKIKPVVFSVEAGGKRIAPGAKIDTYYEETSGYWTCYGTSSWTINESIPIASDGTFYISGGLLDKLTWEGRFVAPDQVEGTFHTEILASVCGVVKNDGTWTATWQGP
jgi:hypothetical protein